MYNSFGDEVDGFLYIDKPIGMTSHDVVMKVKRKLHIDRIGHTGTLDPFASGLLILCLGKATKLAYLFSDANKDYTGSILFGKHYDTYDITGEVLSEKKPPDDLLTIALAATSMVGTYMQLPPMHSAIKIDGKRLYELARQGLDIKRDKREVIIHAFDLTSAYNHHAVNFYASVSKGTYIRSLAVDLAHKMDTFGVLSSLRRTKVGDVDIREATSIENCSLSDLISLETYFKDYPKLILSDYLIHLVKNGVYLDERQIESDHPFIVCDEHSKMIAYYEPIEQNKYKPILIF